MCAGRRSMVPGRRCAMWPAGRTGTVGERGGAGHGEEIVLLIVTDTAVDRGPVQANNTRSPGGNGACRVPRPLPLPSRMDVRGGCPRGPENRWAPYWRAPAPSNRATPRGNRYRSRTGYRGGRGDAPDRRLRRVAARSSTIAPNTVEGYSPRAVWMRLYRVA